MRETLVRSVTKAWAEGATVAEISTSLGIVRASVYKCLHQAGIDHWQNKGVKMAPDDERVAVMLYKAGASTRDIAAHFGMSVHGILHVMRRNGVERSPSGTRPRRFTDDERRDIVALYEDGVPQMKIAEQLKTSQTKISKFLREQGFKDSRAKQHVMRIQYGEYVAVRVPDDDPLACMRNSGGYVPEHRLVMARSIRRPLLKSETVHHINGNKHDNRPENLQLRKGNHGNGSAWVCADCGSHNVVPTALRD